MELSKVMLHIMELSKVVVHRDVHHGVFQGGVTQSCTSWSFQGDVTHQGAFQGGVL